MNYTPTRRVESIKELIIAAYSNKNSVIRKLRLTPQEIFNIWDNVSQFIEYHMENKKAVKIPGLGVFTFTSAKLEVAQNKFVLIQKPVFVVSEKFAQNHRLSQIKCHVPGEIPVIPLNFSALSHELNLGRDVIETSIKEVVNAFSHNVECNPTCEFGFTTLGSLLIHNSLVKMKFLPCFLEKMEQASGLAKIFSKRQAILGDTFPHKPLNCVTEDVYLKRKENQILNNLTEKNEGCEDPLKSAAKSQEVFILSDFQNLPTIHQNLDISAPSKSNAVFPTTPAKKAPTSKSVGFKNAFQKSSNPSKICQFNNGITKENGLKNVSNADDQCANCTENRSDFCYFCYHHNKKNIAVDNTEQRKKKERKYDQILQVFTHLKDSEADQLEKYIKEKKRAESCSIAAFNLEVGESLRNQEKAKTQEFNRSFVFRNREVTPPHYIKQAEYEKALDHLVEEKSRKMKQKIIENKLLDSIERMQIAENFSEEQAHNFKVKYLKSEEYRNALDTQIFVKKYLDKCTEVQEEKKLNSLPKANILLPFQNNEIEGSPTRLQSPYSESEVQAFGIHDIKDEKRLRKRRQNQLLSQNQLKMAVERREKENAAILALRKEEAEMLKKARAELLQESFIRNQHNVMQRLELEKNWCTHVTKKERREAEEKVRGQSPGILLLDQCEKYHRCTQCMRKPANYGKSNVWRESRYVSGSRIML